MREMPGVAVAGLFTAAAFVGSSLLFIIQPLFARLVLPYLGGSPSVWNTCMLFFQALLLLGYLYAHVSTRLLSLRTHVMAHVLLLFVPFAVLPIAIAPPDGSLAGSPTGWLLIAATFTVGAPFLVVSTSAPLLQRWFAALPHPSAQDPYFLYAASNLGSMVALLTYPFALEPMMGLTDQAHMWAWGYGTFALLTATCALVVRSFASNAPGAATESAVCTPALGWRNRLSWLTMAFLPSTLMLGVTTHISTDIAAFPLLWIVPLAIYLLTFVIAFSSQTKLTPARLATSLGLLAFGTFVSLLLNADLIWLIPLHLLTFAVAALFCHLQLADTRPPVSGLTEFYIWLSLGGMLGGVFNSIIAPAIFPTVLEYPLALAAVIVIAAGFRRRVAPAPLSLKGGLLATAAVLLALALSLPETSAFNQARLIGASALATLTIFERRNLGFTVRLFVVIALLAIVTTGRARPAGVVLHTERSFFGIHRVLDSDDGSHRMLYHGNTLHGWQALPDVACEPSSYYSRKGPIGDVFAAARGTFDRVGVVGLGTGALACYAGPGDAWTFYEIDPVVERLATSPDYFSQISRSDGDVSVVVSDGRLGLLRAPAGAYDLIVLDAFSSDSIPVHLLTREAMVLYFSRLSSNGIVAVHVSNRYLQLEPALAALARELHLHGYVRNEGQLSADDLRQGRASSRWVALARRPEDLLGIPRIAGWRPLDGQPAVRVWTDDYANVLQALLLRYGLR